MGGGSNPTQLRVILLILYDKFAIHATKNPDINDF